MRDPGGRHEENGVTAVVQSAAVVDVLEPCRRKAFVEKTGLVRDRSPDQKCRGRGLLDQLRAGDIEISVAVARDLAVLRKQLVDEKDLGDERAKCRQAAQLKLPLRFSLLVEQQRSRGGDRRILIEEVDQLLDGAGADH